MSMDAWSTKMRPQERKDFVRSQLAESARILAELAQRRDVAPAAFETELRLQIAFLSNAASQWHQAEVEDLEILRVRKLMLRREGPGE